MIDKETYEAVVARLEERVANSEITLEDANVINDRAYAQYLESFEAEEDGDDLTLGDIMEGISDYLEEACENCKKVARGETVIGAEGKAGDVAINNDKPFAKSAYAAHPSNESPEQGLGSKVLAKDITGLVDIGNSNSEDITEGVKALRLRVYEAYEAGLIDEESKDNMLSDLDLSNYTEIE